jgi:hypothetical protein
MKIDYNTEMIDRLYNALQLLEDGLADAKVVLDKNKSIKRELYESRISTYEEIITKQRSLTHELEQIIMSPNTAETTSTIHRYISLITGLSEMLKNDIRDLLYTVIYNKSQETND